MMIKDCGTIVHFDATEARRMKMKQKSATPSWKEEEKAPLQEETGKRKDSASREARQEENDLPTREELRAYIVNFVIEQTGYPEEMILLDADLEGDLGIDSIKKAQLMGELNEMFHFVDLSSGEETNLTLDDFPTLGDILDYMVQKQEKKRFTASEPAMCDTPATSAWTEEKDASKLPTREELQAYIVNFVIEQTGYPEEMILLDADLEGDLGIDSIKKAQLMGELNEMFHFVDLSSGEETNLTLDDFPTLGDILDYMMRKRS